MTLNIDYRSENELERLLSPEVQTPFVLHGRQYNSLTGFWQSLKFPRESDRLRIGLLYGYEAKKAGADAPREETFRYGGETYYVGSKAHQYLMRRALRAKFRYNPSILKLLLETGEEEITHILKNKDGNILPDSKTIPGRIFAGMLMTLRSEYRAYLGDGKLLSV